MPTSERSTLLGCCETVDLAFGTVLYAQHEHYDHAYFPVTCFISLMASVSGHPPMEVGMIGREGMLGSSILLGVDRAPSHAIVQGPGMALRLGTDALRDLLPDSPVLAGSLKRSCYRSLVQVVQTAACTRFHPVEARLARWLLLTHDRAQADEFHLTHQFLADMLGVQRSAVTIASGVLKSGRLIEYSRGRINILDRAGLEAAACECYAAARFAIAD